MFAKRVKNTDSSIIREILKLVQNSNIISFAGGIPDESLFPKNELKNIADKLFKNKKEIKKALQYSESAGIYELRKKISETYKKKDNIDIDPSSIIITTGSQQALFMISHVFLEEEDNVLTENPTYLAALQTFSFYTKNIKHIELENDGPRIEKLPENKIKLFYFVPNFQNPTGITWGENKREKIAKWANKHKVILIEDDPYGEIRFEGERQKPMLHYYKNTILLGSFSKILAPGMRLGWIVVPNKKIYEKLLIVKQSMDLHSSTFNQYIIYNYYKKYNTQNHIEKISENYKKKKDAMIASLEKEFDNSIVYTNPEGGMFIWVEFKNKKIDSSKLLEYAIKEGVAFVPGIPFYPKKHKKNTIRLNYTKNSLKEIKEGIKRLKKAVDKYEKSIL